MNISLVGMGMGQLSGLTGEARAALSRAEAIIGAERLVRALAESGEISAAIFAEALPAGIAEIVSAHPEWSDIAVALSGDVGFYSGARQLVDLLSNHEVELFCGISSPQYFAAKLRRPWQDVRLVSAHGKHCDILAEVLNHPEVLFLTGGAMGAAEIVAELCAAGLHDATVSVGENLSSPAERVTTGTAGELAGRAFASLAVVLVRNGRTFARRERSTGIPDGDFIRGGTPMTKREVRAAALSLLAPAEDSVLYDIGSGTGSVAVEMALVARRGRVFAIEQDEEALSLTRRNREAFGAYNMTVVPGSAPDAFAPLPPPDAAFIGGSRGSLQSILASLREKNPRMRIVINAVTLETLSGAVEAMRAGALDNVEVCQISATRTVKRGAYHMLDAQNPVFLISGGGHA